MVYLCSLKMLYFPQFFSLQLVYESLDTTATDSKGRLYLDQDIGIKTISKWFSAAVFFSKNKTKQNIIPEKLDLISVSVERFSLVLFFF